MMLLGSETLEPDRRVYRIHRPVISRSPNVLQSRVTVTLRFAARC